MFSKKMLVLSVSAFLISACGGGGDTDSTTSTSTTASIGVFEDSLVSGLHYETATRSGTTNSSGEFEYLPIETVTFSVGGVVLGSALAGPVITPLTLVDGAIDATDPVVTNIVRLLLTLDSDKSPDNGISISAASAAAAENQSVDFTAANLSTDQGMIALLALLPGSPVLVDAITAQTHFAATLASHSDWGSMTWGNGSWSNQTP